MEGLVESTLCAHGLTAAATHGTGHQQRIGLADTIAPRECVVDVKATFLATYRRRLAVVVEVLGGHRDGVAATHGLLRILLAHHQRAGVAGESQRTAHKQDAHTTQQLRQITLTQGIDGIYHTQHHGTEDGVVGDLYVVADKLQAQGEGEQQPAPQPVTPFLTLSRFPEAQHHARQNGRDHGYAPRLGDMSRLNDDEVVAPQAQRQSTQQAQPRRAAQHHHGKVEAYEIEEQHSSIPLHAHELQRDSIAQGSEDALHRRIATHLVDGHAAKQRTVPHRIVTRLLVVVLGLLDHGLVFLRIALAHLLALEHGSKVHQRHNQEQHYNAYMGQHFLSHNVICYFINVLS